MEKSKTELILVYNAESGFFNLIRDALHRTISPSTYQCNLCALTYGTFKVKDEWKDFADKLEMASKFLHRNEFFKMLETHPHNIEAAKFPAVFLHKDGKLSLLLTADEINRCKTLEELLDLITAKFAAL